MLLLGSDDPNWTLYMSKLAKYRIYMVLLGYHARVALCLLRLLQNATDCVPYILPHSFILSSTIYTYHAIYTSLPLTNLNYDNHYQFSTWLAFDNHYQFSTWLAYDSTFNIQHSWISPNLLFLNHILQNWLNK